MAKDYDVAGAFQAIENELISSMLINFKRHRAWERDEGFDWSMWQAEQLKSMKSYRLNNQKHFGGYFPTINEKIEEMLIKSYAAGNMEQEVEILKAIRRGFKSPEIASGKSTLIQGEFFKVNDRKLDALIKATKDDMVKAEHAMLRKANDEYRKTIFNAQVYANTGSGTMEKAVDMATKDFLSKGINCIEYSNGAMVNIVDYVGMAIQTANKRAYLQGEGAKRQEWGISTVIVTRRGAGCHKCVKHQGRIYIDDVWSGGTSKDGNYPLISSAMAAGLYHPRCKDTHTTYFEGITSEPTPPTKAEQQKAVETYNLQQKQRYNERQIKKYKNLEAGSLDKDNQDKYKARRMQWQQIQRELVDNNSDIISRNYEREKIERYNFNIDESQNKMIYKETNINVKYVNSSEYRRKFDNITDNADVNRMIYKKSKEMLQHRKGTKFEDMCLIDSDNGKVLAEQVNGTIEDAVTYNKKMDAVVANANPNTIIGLHNHPSSVPPSESDINSALVRRYKTGVIACHDGRVFVYTASTNKIPELEYLLRIAKYKKNGYNEIEAQIMALNELKQKYNFEFREV